MTIDRFQGAHRWLSNFWSCFVMLDWIEYPSVENAYQAAKTLDPAQREVFVRLFPSAAKRMGRKVTLRPDWESVKLDIMEQLLRQKFRGELFERLKLTAPAQLIEGNDWGDRYWGVDAATGEGENHLGRLLMKIRDQEEHGDDVP